MFTPQPPTPIMWSSSCLLGFVCIQIIIIIINIIIVLVVTETGQAGRLTDDPEEFKGRGAGSVSFVCLFF